MSDLMAHVSVRAEGSTEYWVDGFTDEAVEALDGKGGAYNNIYALHGDPNNVNEEFIVFVPVRRYMGMLYRMFGSEPFEKLLKDAADGRKLTVLSVEVV